MKLRIGLIGLGKDWDSRLAPALRALGDRYVVRAVCEEVTLRAEQAARQFEADVVEGFRAVVRRDDVDAVFILSGRWFGPLPILAACEHGKAVYCSPSWDCQAGQLAGLKKHIDEAGIAFMADFPRRVAPATLRLKELIATRLGRPRLLFCHFRQPLGAPAKSSTNGHFHINGPEAASEHRLLELIDWCHYVVGQYAGSVSGFWHRAAGGAHSDYQTVSLDFSAPGELGQGPLAQVSCGSYMPSTWPEAISFRPPAALQVCCENGVAFVDLPSTLVWFDAAGRHMESLDHERPASEQLLWQFHRQVTSFIRDRTSMDDVFAALETLEHARQSFREARRVFVDECS